MESGAGVDVLDGGAGVGPREGNAGVLTLEGGAEANASSELYLTRSERT